MLKCMLLKPIFEFFKQTLPDIGYYAMWHWTADDNQALYLEARMNDYKAFLMAHERSDAQVGDMFNLYRDLARIQMPAYEIKNYFMTAVDLCLGDTQWPVRRLSFESC